MDEQEKQQRKQQERVEVRPEWVSPLDGRVYPFGEPVVWLQVDAARADPMCQWW